MPEPLRFHNTWVFTQTKHALKVAHWFKNSVCQVVREVVERDIGEEVYVEVVITSQKRSTRKVSEK